MAGKLLHMAPSCGIMGPLQSVFAQARVKKSVTADPFQSLGGLEPIPADIGLPVGHTLDKWPVHHRADIYSFIEKCNVNGSYREFCGVNKAIPPPLKTHDTKVVFKCFSHTTRRKCNNMVMEKALKCKVFSDFNLDAKLRIDNRTMRINTKY